jgi:hypothetical protein
MIRALQFVRANSQQSHSLYSISNVQAKRFCNTFCSSTNNYQWVCIYQPLDSLRTILLQNHLLIYQIQPKNYNPQQLETKWQQKWLQNQQNIQIPHDSKVTMEIAISY